MKKILGIITMLAVLTFVGTAFAYDYSDADWGYGIASAATPEWNRLGLSWTGDTSALAVAGDLDTDDGVLWSINGGAYGHDAIIVGDTVTFQFTLSKVEWGRHTADYLKAWIDWNNDMDFTDDGEMVLAEAYANTIHTEADGSSTQFLSADHSPVIVGTYFYTTTFYDAGDYWLRARVVCSGDVPVIDNVLSTGYYYQGEIEDWELTVNNKVPEPATMLLLGFGLIGLAGIRRKA